MADRYPIIFIKNTRQSTKYTSPQGGGGTTEFPVRDRVAHGNTIGNRFQNLWNRSRAEQQNRDALAIPSAKGVYLDFKSTQDFPLISKGLEDLRQGIRISNIRKEGNVEFATVFVPNGKENVFLTKIADYLNPEKDGVNPRNGPLINSIDGIELAVLESFWQHHPDLLPLDAPSWVEVWLRAENDVSSQEQFNEICVNFEIEVKEGVLRFPEREVVLINANRDQLINLIKGFDKIAEFRLAYEAISFFMDIPNTEQAEWAGSLRQRVEFNDDSGTSILILDTGINNGHPLLDFALSDDDMHSYDIQWGVSDHDGHGTNMSGLALYDNLADKLVSQNQISLKHRLESGKILPPNGQNPHNLYGYITTQLISRAEIQRPEANRVICMAVSSDEHNDGKPSSWSGAIDSLCSGYIDNKKRLIVLSTGNVVLNHDQYPEINKISNINSPAQSWNALTVGAYTSLVTINNPALVNYNPTANLDGLSPFSRTSNLWESKKWPLKPDVLFEGGNTAIDPTGFHTEVDELSLLTLSKDIQNNLFDVVNMTSAATAKASWFASQLLSEYPESWPETIRALIVHSADWTLEMRNQFMLGNTVREQYHNLLRVCGYGIPNLEKAKSCASNSLILVTEETIQPFTKDNGTYKTNEIHYYAMPWPEDELLNLGGVQVKIRLTLSYFIEPGPGEIGWKDRYRYRSHGFKFDVNNVNEDFDQFKARVNKVIRAENEGVGLVANDSDRWTIGSQTRNLGSIHSDVIEGTAADLSSCKYFSVAPITGWWKERHHLNRYNKVARYSLIISVETPSVEMDVYTPVAIKLNIPIVNLIEV